jgi:hypothetical protein
MADFQPEINEFGTAGDIKKSKLNGRSDWSATFIVE